MAKPIVFVVDDQKDLRDSISEELEERGYAIMAAPNGDGALALLRKKGARPSLILLDLLMPGGDGWQVVEKMKADPDLREVPIVVMSAAPPGETMLKAQGVAATLAKPFTIEELLFVVTRFLPVAAPEKSAGKSADKSAGKPAAAARKAPRR